MKNNYANILKILLATAIIYWLVRSGLLDYKQLIVLLKGPFLFFGLLLCFASIFINNYRWFLLLKCQGFSVSLPSTLNLTFIGLFFNLAMPGGVGGDLVKGYYVVQDNPSRKMAAAASILVDRVIGFFSMVLMSLTALGVNFHLMDGRKELQSLAFGAGGLFLLFLSLMALALSSRFMRWFKTAFQFIPGGHFLGKLHEVFYGYRDHLSVLGLGLLLSVVSQAFTVVLFVLVGESMGVAIPIQAYFFVVPVGLIAMAAPISPAGIGVGQAAFLALFNMYLGFNSSVGPTAATANQIVMLIWGLVGSIFYFRRKRPQNLEWANY